MTKMNKMAKFKLAYTFTLIILCIIVFVYLIYEINNENIDSNKEGFTSGFRQMFRPSMRSARLFFEKHYNSFKKNSSLFFRKIGLI